MSQGPPPRAGSEDITDFGCVSGHLELPDPAVHRFIYWEICCYNPLTWRSYCGTSANESVLCESTDRDQAVAVHNEMVKRLRVARFMLGLDP